MYERVNKMDYNTEFEKLAEEFNREHGFYPLGKDVLYERPVSDAECMKLWAEFLGKKMAEKSFKKIVQE